jgi:hypothetical protein
MENQKEKPNQEKGAKTMETRVTTFNIVGIDPTRFWTDGRGFWRDDEGKVFVDAVLLTLSKEDAYWVSVACGQVCFLHVDFEKEPNGYILEAKESDLSRLFQDGRITGYTVLKEVKLKDGIPETFTVLSPEEAEALPADYKAWLRPVYFEFVYTS